MSDDKLISPATAEHGALWLHDPEGEWQEYCAACAPPEHDQCSLTPGCPCCDDRKDS